MPAIYISKYNRFVDNIIGRINRILGKSYDPVRVKLQSNEVKKSNNKKKTTKPKVKNATRKKNHAISSSRPTTKQEEMPIARAENSEAKETSFILISKNGEAPTLRNITVKTEKTQTRASGSSTKNKKRKTNKNKTKAGSTKNKTKANSSAKARATLFGLSSIKRDGDVTVNMMSDHTTVKTNFILGPLTLRVEREFGKGARRELKSATATTAEMYGRLNLRIVHGGAATLHSIKVLQPKQMRIDSAEDHEKTKEFLWKRTSHIASVVSQKLASAAKSMLKPPPKP